jgi:hypothetical protein
MSNFTSTLLSVGASRGLRTGPVHDYSKRSDGWLTARQICRSDAERGSP